VFYTAQSDHHLWCGDRHICTIRPNLGSLLSIPAPGKHVVPRREVSGDFHLVKDVETEAIVEIFLVDRLANGANPIAIQPRQWEVWPACRYNMAFLQLEIRGNPKGALAPPVSPQQGAIGFFVHCDPAG